MKGIYKLHGVVQHYSWGGTEFIPQLTGVGNPDKKPFAEYWLGAHPNALATLDDGGTLQDLISENPVQILGQAVNEDFGSLPYLFKILDVRQMLSIQVHPSKASAEEEYERENAKGIPLTAPHRNYKDKNHKPELMAALGDFYLLHGFKPDAEIRAVFSRVEELSFLLPVFEQGGYKALYEEVMTMPQAKVDEVLAPLMGRLVPLYNQGGLQKGDEHFWAARAALTFCKNENYDRGIFSVYLFNLLHLKKGEAIYQAAGLPHAYLEGQNVEVMANSDNVLRAGLTDKHVDVLELMKHVRFEATHPAIIRTNGDAEQSFDTPAEEFHLVRFEVQNAVTLSPQSGTVLFVYEGEALIAKGAEGVALTRGEAVFLPPQSDVLVTPHSGRLHFYTVAAATEKKAGAEGQSALFLAPQSSES